MQAARSNGSLDPTWPRLQEFCLSDISGAQIRRFFLQGSCTCVSSERRML